MPAPVDFQLYARPPRIDADGGIALVRRLVRAGYKGSSPATTFSENGHRSFERFRVTSLGGDRATIMQKPWTARTGEHALGIWNDQFLRVLISGDESKLLAVELSTGKSTTVALPVERAKGAIVDRSDQGVTLRLVTLEDEHRLPLRMGSKLEVDSTSRTVTPHGLAGSVRPAPGGGWTNLGTHTPYESLAALTPELRAKMPGPCHALGMWRKWRAAALVCACLSACGSPARPDRLDAGSDAGESRDAPLSAADGGPLDDTGVTFDASAPLDAWRTEAGADASAAMCPASTRAEVYLPLARLSGTFFVSPREAPRMGVIFGASCAPGGGEFAEDVYSLHVSERVGLVVRIPGEPVARPRAAVLGIRQVCDEAASEVACLDASAVEALTTRAAMFRLLLEPGDYALVAESNVSRPAGGPLDAPYDFELSAFSPAPNASCESAAELRPEAPLRAQETRDGALSSARLPGCFGGVEHPDTGELFYRVTAPPRTRLRWTAVPPTDARRGWAVVRAFDACPLSACVAIATEWDERDATVLSLDNDSDAERSYYVSVRPALTDRGTSFDVSVELTPLP